MKFIIISIFLILPSWAMATDYKVTDGKILFASVTVNGIDAFTTQDYNQIISSVVVSFSSSPIAIIAIVDTPSTDELALSTVVSRWNSSDEYSNCLNSKPAFAKKYQEIKPALDSAIDLGDNSTDAQSRKNWMINFYGRLSK